MSQITNKQEKLIDEFKSGNKDVFPLIIDNIKNSLYKTIYAILENRENTIEVLDEVIYMAYTQMQKLKHNEFFYTWITRIAINECRDFIKKNSKITYISEYDESASIKNIDDMQIEKLNINQALNKLTEEVRLILVMKLYLEYTFDDISNTLSKPVSTVKTIYYNGMQKLRKLLSE